MDIASKFKDIQVLVVGDVMLDRYWWGDVTRISPEAPVPVVRLNGTSLAPGGAANVAANIAETGATPLLIGCIGTDTEADDLTSLLKDVQISTSNILRIPERKTTVKTRVIAHSQQVARVDQETVEPLSESSNEEISDSFELLIDKVQAVAISDYAKGVLSEQLVSRLIDIAKVREIPVIVDPKGRDYSRYRGATILTPNRREAALACKLDEDENDVVSFAGERLLRELDLAAVLITEGEEGMTLFERGKAQCHLSASAREVYDVTGAGDTVIAVLSAALGAGFGIYEASKIANIAAGLAVEKIGTAVVSIRSIQAAFDTFEFRAVQ